MIRPFIDETVRYGQNGKPAEYSKPGEFVYDHPFQWGSKRTGPDLHRVGGKYSDEWHRLHLNNPRDLVPESNMPAYPWLLAAKVDDESIAAHMTGLRRVGVPYTDQEIAQAAGSVRGQSEIDALVAYLQVLGTSIK
jgi:cytochrome c oxidase cbb3-type subunit 2